MKNRTQSHTLKLPFPVKNNLLHIGGVPLTQLAMRAGKTPFYAYDRKAITSRIKYLRSYLPDTLKLHYAVKANPMPALVNHISTLVDGFDVASGGELKTVLDTTMPPDEISFAGPGKTVSELKSAIAAGITLNVESKTELDRIYKISDDTGITPRIAIRVNPDFELKSSGMKMSGGPKQFGIDAEQVPDILKSLDSNKVDFLGFHIFSGSQNLVSQSIIEAQRKTLDLAYRLSEHINTSVKMINIGGGFGIPYFPGETQLDIKPVCENLHALVDEAASRLPGANLILELGRYIVGEAGIYVTRVIDKKVSRGQTFAITDGGLHHHLAASGNFGQVIRKNYPVIIGTKADDEPDACLSIVGPLCTPLDILADKMTLPDVNIGDLVVILQSGAYGFTASPVSFLSHPPPLEIFV